MKKILHNVIKKKTINLIKELGKGHSELVFDIYLDMGKFDTIEYKSGQIILHIFKSDNYDITFDYEILSENDKIKIITYLKDCLTSQ